MAASLWPTAHLANAKKIKCTAAACHAAVKGCQEFALPAAIVAETVARHRLLHNVRRLGVAVSGGADSVALLHLLLPLCRRSAIEPLVLHFDHGLRGVASAGDAAFVVELAGRLGVPLVAERGVVEAGGGVSLEMAARAARFDFFAAAWQQERLDAIATGHHADDVAELLLLRLARGAGSSGLAGLRPRSNLRHGGVELCLIRPLLDVGALRLRQWLKDTGHHWREDTTNYDAAIARNAVRHKLLPLLADHFGGNPVPALVRTAELLRADDELLEQMAAAWLAQHEVESPDQPTTTLACRALLAEPLALQRRIVRRWLIAAGLSGAAGFETVARLLAECDSGEPWQRSLPGGWELQSDGCQLRLIPLAAGPVCREAVQLKLPGTTMWYGYTIEAQVAAGIDRSRGVIGQWPATASLALETVGEKGLTVRQWRPGDRIAPLGMAGSRKVQDLLVDAKVPREVRRRLPLIWCGTELVWLPGYRVARRFAVASDTTPALQLRISDRSELAYPAIHAL